MSYTANGYYEKQYITKQNDTFDRIAKYFYNDENVASYIIAVNPQYSTVLVFDEGTPLYLPHLIESEASTLPAWKGGL